MNTNEINYTNNTNGFISTDVTQNKRQATN